MKNKIILCLLAFVFVETFAISNTVFAATSKCKIRVNGSCFTGPKYVKAPLSSGGCGLYKDKLGIKTCNANPDYWATAVHTCGGINKMASLSDLMAISSAIHTKYNEFDDDLVAKWGLGNIKYIWTNSEDYGSCSPKRRLDDCIAKRDPKTTELEVQKQRCEFIANFRGHFCAEDESGAMAMDLSNTLPTALRSGFVIKKRFEKLPFLCKLN